MEKNLIPRIFLLILLAFILYLSYLVFLPFLKGLIVAMILATIFYPSYQKLTAVFRGYKSLASFTICVLIALVVILPIIFFTIYFTQRTIEAVPIVTSYVNRDTITAIIHHPIVEKFIAEGIDPDSLRTIAFNVLSTVSEWLVARAGSLFAQISSFIVTLPIILLTVFFFFIDGESMLKKVMLWTPLPNKYDQDLFRKFRDVSRSTIFSSMVTAVVQGIIGALGFMIVGLPAFFPGVIMAFTSLLPYIGAGIIWVPIALYLLVTAPLWKGIFLLIWGFAVLSSVDNLIRAYLIKDKAHVHPIFVFFSVLGGLAIFGFWGVVFGPLIIALAVTVLHIYEKEYGHVLDGNE